MATRWENVLRQIFLKGNFIAPGDATATASAYAASPITSAIITASGAEFPFTAVCDKVIAALELMIRAIGENRNSHYRAWFLDETPNVGDGARIPLESVANVPRIGVIANVRDADDGTYLTFAPRKAIQIARAAHPRRLIQPYQFYTDDVRIYHTRTFVVCEIVSWDRAAEYTNIVTNNNSTNCPLPEDLHPALEDGALALIHRDTFNVVQAEAAWQRFVPELNRIAGKPIADEEMLQKV